MVHPNAALTPRHRLQVARLVVDDGYPISEVAARLQHEHKAPGGGQTSGVAAVAQMPRAGATRCSVRNRTVDRPPGARQVTSQSPIL